MARKQTRFNLQWLDPAIHPEFNSWLGTVKDDDTKAFCRICCKVFSLSNMGKCALISHANSSSHVEIKRSKSEQTSLVRFLTPTNSNSSNSQQNVCETASVVEEKSKIINEQSLIKSTFLSSTLTPFVIKDDVIKAEITWALAVVKKKMSLNSCTDIKNIFKKMFPDSSIATQFQLGPDKASYIINYGLAHYFREKLIDGVTSCDNITISFDKSLNKVAQRTQMDLVIKHWDESKDKVMTRYLNSVFLDHSTDTHLDLAKILHICMDGPNVNINFLNKLEDHMETQNVGKSFVRMETCGLHVVHGAVKAGFKVVDWNLLPLLRNLYYLLKDSPTRRAEYIAISGSRLFPKKFGSTRWLENGECLERAAEVIESVKTYINNSTKLKDSKVATFLRQALNDPFIKVKLLFFQSICTQSESFLTRFQSNKPLAPYLYKAVVQLLMNLMRKFVKNDRVTDKQFLKIDLNANENLVHLKNLDIGFGVKKVLKELKVSDKDILCFIRDCQKVLKVMTQKIIEKGPVKYKCVKALSSLDPEIIKMQSNVGKLYFNALLEILHDTNRIDERCAVKAKEQYNILCNKVSIKPYSTKFEDFISERSDDDGLDTFYCEIMKDDRQLQDLWSIIKISLSFSHGNASVESGFSVNKSLLSENLKEESLVAQCLVYDGIHFASGVDQINIDQNMLLTVRGSRQLYTASLQQKKDIQKQQALRAEEKRKLTQQLKDLKQHKKMLRKDHEKEEKEIEMKINTLEEKKLKLH
ncbi:uncharacterized protein [Centruroides vittatus]|uniref:uncharacterized protein n=1 Tax=Centruroides vittatus TaxID=120091 RepID=UPI00350EC5D9